jgi:predicted double-glycine peptidase
MKKQTCVGTNLRDLFLAASLALCLFSHHGFASSIAQLPNTPKLPSTALALPTMPQATDFSCGPATLLSVLSYWGAYDGNEESLYPILDTTRKDGTHPKKLEEGAKLMGLQAELKTGMTLDNLRDALSQGKTVILDIQAWPDPVKVPNPDWKNMWDDGHYVALKAMDNSFAYFTDSAMKTGFGYMPLGELLDRWHDFEDRTGAIERYVQTGIVIWGKTPLKRFPDQIARIH